MISWIKGIFTPNENINVCFIIKYTPTIYYGVNASEYSWYCFAKNKRKAIKMFRLTHDDVYYNIISIERLT